MQKPEQESNKSPNSFIHPSGSHLEALARQLGGIVLVSLFFQAWIWAPWLLSSMICNAYTKHNKKDCLQVEVCKQSFNWMP